MTLENFEKELARKRKHEDARDKDREAERSEKRHRRHHHHHHSSRHHEPKEDDESGHAHKRRRHSYEEHSDDRQSRHNKKHKHGSRNVNEDDGASKAALLRPQLSELKRDSWMEAPSALDVDYIQRPLRHPSPPKAGSLEADFELKLHEKELNHHLKDLRSEKRVDDLPDEAAQHEVSYTFGDSGSQWRMTKLKAVYRQVKESGRKIDDVAVERYGDLRDFDDAREEELELGRRETYGKGYLGKEKPSGELYQERKLEDGVRRSPQNQEQHEPEADPRQGRVIQKETPAANAITVDQTSLNRMKAAVLRAQLRNAPDVTKLEEDYSRALAAFQSQKSDIITLSAMDNRMLSSAARNEVVPASNRRDRERGVVESNEDMSIEDMIREERRTRTQPGGEGQRFAERIAKDAKFDNDLEYMDENAGKLAKRVQKTDINLRNTAIHDFQKLNKILDNCPLCHHEDIGQPPTAPVVSLATTTYLTLPTEPELSDGGACIVPIQHRTNLLECDDDEWEEIRNFMKSLTRLYHDQGRDVIFYENAAFPHRKPHAALNVVPLPYSLGETAPAFFKEALLSAENEWTQHKKIIDTLAKSKQGLGKLAFRRALVKEMPYFHVWFEIDGGVGHIVEDSQEWPKGDLFAREVIGGMLDLGLEVIKKQGRWHKGHDGRVEGFRKRWRKFDWTRVLTEE